MWQLVVIHVIDNSELCTFNHIICNTSIIRVYLKTYPFKCGWEKITPQQCRLNATINIPDHQQIQNLLSIFISHMLLILWAELTHYFNPPTWALLRSSYPLAFLNAGMHPKRWKYPCHAPHVYQWLDLFQPKTSTFSTHALIWVHFKAVH